MPLLACVLLCAPGTPGWVAGSMLPTPTRAACPTHTCSSPFCTQVTGFQRMAHPQPSWTRFSHHLCRHPPPPPMPTVGPNHRDQVSHQRSRCKPAGQARHQALRNRNACDLSCLVRAASTPSQGLFPRSKMTINRLKLILDSLIHGSQ